MFTYLQGEDGELFAALKTAIDITRLCCLAQPVGVLTPATNVSCLLNPALNVFQSLPH